MTMKIVDSRTITTVSDLSLPKTFFLATKHSKLYIAAKSGTASPSSLERADPSTWKPTAHSTPPQKFDPANLYPAAKPSYHRFRYRKGEDHTKVFKKHRSPLDVATDHDGLTLIQSDRTARLTKREIETCERLREHPHHNVAKYRGVQCSSKLSYTHRGETVQVRLDTERVVKLLFKRYDCTLWDLVTHRQVVNMKQCLNSIAAGISHLHSLGIVHSDIKPKNVFVSREEGKDPEESLHYVVGDFDSCHRVGERMNLKSGHESWTRKKRSGDRAEAEDDWYAFGRLEAWLEMETERYR